MIRLENINKVYQSNTQHVAIDNLNLTINSGEFCTFVGPSGCGKTTILKVINYLEQPDQGDVFIQDEKISKDNIIQIRRKIGFVMQNAALFPHRTIAENIATVPRLLGWDKSKIQDRINTLVELMSLNSDLLHRYPNQLSGGQQGRVAIARALAADPPILLMDEPFAAIDPVVRDRLQGDLLELQQRLHKTIILVTHDINEAIRLGDKIAVFKERGILEQFDTPENILAHPSTDFVRGFIGSESNLKRLGMILVEQLPRYDTELLNEDLSNIPSEFPSLPGNLPQLILDHDQRPLKWLYSQNNISESVQTISNKHTLREAYNNLLDTPTGILVKVNEHGVYTGCISHQLIQQVITHSVDVKYV